MAIVGREQLCVCLRVQPALFCTRQRIQSSDGQILQKIAVPNDFVHLLVGLNTHTSAKKVGL